MRGICRSPLLPGPKRTISDLQYSRVSDAACPNVEGGGSRSHQPRLMAGHSWRGSLAGSDLWIWVFHRVKSQLDWQKKKIFTAQTEQAAKQKGWLFWTNWLQSGHWRAILARFAQLHVSICQSVFGITSLKGHWFNPFLCKSSDLRAWRVDLCSLHTRQRWITQTCVLVQEQMSAFTTPLFYTQSLGRLQTFTCHGNTHREVLKPLLTSPGLVYVFKWLFCYLRWKKRMRESGWTCSLPQEQLVITGTAELGWRWPSEHWQSPQAKNKQKKKNRHKNTEYRCYWKTFYLESQPELPF